MIHARTRWRRLDQGTGSMTQNEVSASLPLFSLSLSHDSDLAAELWMNSVSPSVSSVLYIESDYHSLQDRDTLYTYHLPKQNEITRREAEQREPAAQGW